MTNKNGMRELADKELDAVCGGGGFSTGDIWARQTNVAVVNKSRNVWIYQLNNANTGFQAG